MATCHICAMVEKILTKIKSERIKKGYSQEYLASSLNISQSSYNKIENGKAEMTLSMFFKITSVLELEHIEQVDVESSAESLL